MTFIYNSNRIKSYQIILNKMSIKESVLSKNKYVLLYQEDINNVDFFNLKENFCGNVSNILNVADVILSNKIVYLCGNVNTMYDQIKDRAHDVSHIYVIKDFANNYEICDFYTIVNIGFVPINIHNVGVYFRNFFDNTNYNHQNKDYFNLIKNQHEFQTLTESNKPGSAFRKGIYLSKVDEINDELRFNLLRCSSNFEGPTDCFKDVDNEIISQVNNISKYFFEDVADINHVLAQIYDNSKGKAKIKEHSDKTKDMPRNGLIAFCSFYDVTDMKMNKIKQSKTNMFDYCYNETSALTRLEFKLKDVVATNDLNKHLVKEFNLTLFPNSVFIIPMSTNRLYTHSIRPSVLPAEILPTRMGYVMRCSNTKAVFKDNNTYIEENNVCTKLEDITDDHMNKLRKLYFEENTTDKLMEYEPIYFSMNKGDYLKPNK